MSMGLRQVHPPGGDPGAAPYAAGIVAGDLVFVSGQVALDAQGQVIAPGDLSGQVESVFDRIRGVLGAAGAGLDDVASCTVFLTRAEDFAEFNRSWTQAFGEHRPTRVTVVAELLVPGLLVEIQSIAVKAPRPDSTATDRRNIDVS
jgi:2-iminobutanoate/2-iminopropanoate deaminase